MSWTAKGNSKLRLSTSYLDFIALDKNNSNLLSLTLVAKLVNIISQGFLSIYLNLGGLG